MSPNLRKFALTVHLTCSVGWIGAVGAYLALVVAAMTSPDDQRLRAAWLGMELLGWYAIVPLALAALLTGVVMSLATSWGLFRHYWVVISLLLTSLATGVLLQHMQTVSFFARIAAETGSADAARLRAALRGELLHAGMGLLVLLVIEGLNVYKPQGMTAYGRRRASRVPSPSHADDQATSTTVRGPAPATPLWVRVVGIHAIGLILLFVIMQGIGGRLWSH